MIQTIYARPTLGPEADATTVPADPSWAGEFQGGVAEVWKGAFQKLLEELHAQGQQALEQRRAAFQESLERERVAYERGRQYQAELDKIRADGEAEIAKIYATRRLPIDYIRGPIGEGHIYVVAFSTGTVKVGQTEDPRVRLNNHQAEAAAFGVGTVSYWVSPPHWNFKENETLLIDLCRKVGRRSRREYYHEVGFDRAVDFAWTLDFRSRGPQQPAVTCGVPA